MHRILGLLFALVFLIGRSFAVDSPSATRKWDFETDTVGHSAAGFLTVSGNWSIADDGRNRVLAQSAKSEDAAFNLVLNPGVLFSEVELTVRLKAIDGVVDQGGGLVWRAKNAQTYYLARYNPLEDSFRVYKVVDGKRMQLGSIKATGDRDWHTLRVSMKGSRIQCSLDGNVNLDVEDSSIRGYGRIGLWSKSDAQTYFDDLKATGEFLVPQSTDPPTESKEFEIKNDRAYLGGHQINLWGLRCGNAFCSDAVTERFIRNFDNMNAHGINLVGAYIQGVNAGHPNADAGLNGFTRHGKLLPEVERRIEWFVREADKRGMVVMIGVITPRKDQDFYDEADMRMAIEETARFLMEKKLRNVFANLCDEFNHP